MSFTKDDLKKSSEKVGQIYPVLISKDGKIIDGYHRKFVDPDWKEERLDVDDPLKVLAIRVNSNFRRDVPPKEKYEWVADCRKLLQERGAKGTQQEIADALGVSRTWVTKFDLKPTKQLLHTPTFLCLLRKC